MKRDQTPLKFVEPSYMPARAKLAPAVGLDENIAIIEVKND
jgi:hypothetical protein